MNSWRQTPIFVTNRDNLNRGFRKLLNWLITQNLEVTVIDNASTWQPLLEYYEKWSGNVFHLIRLTENQGPYAFWKLGLHSQIRERFIVTDPDVIPAATCRRDLIQKMHQAMDTLPASPCKVGPSLTISNLPDHYAHKQSVIQWEEQFWLKPVGAFDAYDALIDTTFALYHPGSDYWPATGTHYRLAPPYSFEHVPWYEDSSQPNEERDYYLSHADLTMTHWSRQ